MQWIDIDERTPTIDEQVIALSTAGTENTAVYRGDGRFQIHDKMYPSLRVYLAGVKKWRQP